MKKTIYILVLAVVVAACKNEDKDTVMEQDVHFKDLQEQTLELHDEVMAEMGTVMDLSMAIDIQLDSEEISEEQVAALRAAQVELDLAQNAMMDWMKSYSITFPYEEDQKTEESVEEKMPLLKDYYEQIKQIQEQTDKAIVEAEELLKESEL